MPELVSDRLRAERYSAPEYALGWWWILDGDNRCQAHVVKQMGVYGLAPTPSGFFTAADLSALAAFVAACNDEARLNAEAKGREG